MLPRPSHQYGFLQKNWADELSSLLSNTENHLLISSPFVSREGADFVLGHLGSNTRSGIRLHFLTNLSPQNICQGATDPEAVRSLAEHITSTTVTHLPRLHAKVYLADTKCAIVTSGNLTGGGLMRNQEYGVLTTDPAAVSQIRRDIEDFGQLGTRIGLDQLLTYCAVAKEIQKSFKAQLSSARKEAREEFARNVRAAEDQLIRVRFQRASPTKIFEDTILYLLKTQGPLSTRQMHPQIQALHPDLCDDTVDRVIDGQHFGKRWKHMVRAAQSHLKDRSLAETVAGRWKLVGNQ